MGVRENGWKLFMNQISVIAKGVLQKRLQAVVAYCYAAPHPIFGSTFRSYEHASLVVLSPGAVSIYAGWLEHHVRVNPERKAPAANQWGEIRGYRSLYNFKHHFSVTNGSRIYGTVPDIGLNISQDLAADFGQFFLGWTGIRSLVGLVERPESAASERMLRAIMWFNQANSLEASEERSILSLAIAFETLLSLPERESITDRLTDAISLLLGRLPRLDSWVRQFYQARSEVVHRGHTEKLRFVTGDVEKNPAVPVSGPLLAYGRQVFQLCIATLLVGVEVACQAGLEEKLVTNQERFGQICRILADETIPARQRLEDVTKLVETVERYKFVSESTYPIDTLLGPTRLAAKVLLEYGEGLDPALQRSLETIAQAKRSADNYETLDALYHFQQQTPVVAPSGKPLCTVGLTLVDWSGEKRSRTTIG